MRTAGLVLALVTVASLEVILYIAAAYGWPRPAWFGALTATMDLALLGSSVILGRVLLERGRRLFGWLFLANPGLMAGALALRLVGVELSQPILFGADLYWLNLYLLGLCREWRVIRGQAAI